MLLLKQAWKHILVKKRKCWPHAIDIYCLLIIFTTVYQCSAKSYLILTQWILCKNILMESYFWSCVVSSIRCSLPSMTFRFFMGHICSKWWISNFGIFVQRSLLLVLDRQNWVEGRVVVIQTHKQKEKMAVDAESVVGFNAIVWALARMLQTSWTLRPNTRIQWISSKKGSNPPERTLSSSPPTKRSLRLHLM